MKNKSSHTIRDSSGKIPSPFNLIKNYLGVCVNSEFKYICLNVEKNNYYITSDKQSANEKINSHQIDILKKFIQILKRNSPLCPLSQQESFEKIPEEFDVHTNDSFCTHIAENYISKKAEVISSIFYDRIKPLLCDSHAESYPSGLEQSSNVLHSNLLYHCTLLTGALEWHLAMNLEVKPIEYIPESVESLYNLISPVEYMLQLRQSTACNISSSSSSRSGSLSSSLSSLDNSLKKSDHSDSSKSKTSDHNDSSKSKTPDHSDSPKSRKLTNSGNWFHLHRTSFNTLPPKNISERNVSLNLISLSGLYNCRMHWIRSYKNQVNFDKIIWDTDEYILIEKYEMLKYPMMHSLVQYELSKDITGDFDIHKLMQDIHRNLEYIVKYHPIELKFISRKINLSILNLKIRDNNTHILKISDIRDHILPATKITNINMLDEYDSKVSYFHHFLRQLLSGIGMINQQTILDKWKDCAKEQVKEGIIDESFIIAGENFFKLIDIDDIFCSKLVILLKLLRQKNYVHPFSVIREVIPDIPVSFQYDDPNRLIQFTFPINGLVEFRTSIKAIVSKKFFDSSESKECSKCEIELLNTMSAHNKRLNSWYSEIEINVNIIRPIQDKKLDQIPKNIKDRIIDPLNNVGFNININYVATKLAKSY